MKVAEVLCRFLPTACRRQPCLLPPPIGRGRVRHVRGTVRCRRPSSHPLTSPNNLRYCTPVGHSAQTRSEAVAHLREHESVAETHRATGIAKSTLSDWARDEGIDLGRTTAKMTAVVETRWAERRAMLVTDLAGLAEESVVKAREFMADDRPADAKAAAITAAVGIDKAQLLSGAATERHETLAPERNPEQGEELAAVLELVRDVA